MKHKLRNIVFIAATTALLGWASVQSARAAAITVTNTADSGPGSLRDALASAADGDIIDATGVSGTILLTSGQLDVSNSVTILGPGPGQLAVDGNGTSRVFYVASNLTAVVAGLTVTNGVATNSPSPEYLGGGGIWNDHSILTISNCTVRGNSAGEIGGGGIWNDGSFFNSATMTVIASTISGNSSQNGNGGGIFNDGRGSSATMTVIASTLSDNSASYSGGAIASSAYLGGSNTTLIVINSTFSDNSALLGVGGGIFNDYHFIDNPGSLVVNSCTFSGNSAASNNFGGAIYNVATMDIGNSILDAGATGGTITNIGTINSYGFNLSSDDGGGYLNATGDQINKNPMIEPLADNGGPTFTCLPLPNSPAVGQGVSDAFPPLVLTNDQRGFPRTLVTTIGSVQVVPPSADLSVSMAVASSIGKAGQMLTYTITVENVGPDAAGGVVVDDAVPAGTTFASASPAASSGPPVRAAGTVVWNVGTLNSGASATCTLKVLVSTKGSTLVSNTANVTGSTPDPNLANNTVSVTSRRIVK